MNEPLVFIFPLPLNLANSRMHWRTRNREKKAFYACCDNFQLWGDFPPPPREPFIRATIRATVHAWNKGDTGNVMGRMKWIEDWLVTRGYLVDDSEKHLTWEGFPKQIIDRKKKQIIITLTPTG